jgi:hypothetical protein
VPLGAVDDETLSGRETVGRERDGAWSEARSAQLVDLPDGTGSHRAALQRATRLRRGASVSLWAAGGAAMAAMLIALTTGSAPRGVGASARSATTTSTAASANRAAASAALLLPTSHRHRQVRSHSERPHHTKRTHPRQTRTRPANPPSVVAVSYTARHPATPATTQSSPTSPVSYTRSVSRTATPTPTPTRTSTPATTNASAARSSAQNRPAFGSDGLLGPGSSPDG